MVRYSRGLTRAQQTDLTRAGYAADAGLLNQGRLPGRCSTTPPSRPTQRSAKKHAAQEPPKRRKHEKDVASSKRERASEAQSNLEISHTLGLNVGDREDDEALDDLFGSRGFSLEAVAEGCDDERVYSHHDRRGHESGTFDSSSSVLIVRVSSAGLSLQVGEPHKIDKTSLEIPVSRQNQPTVVQQLAPKAVDDANENGQNAQAAVRRAHGLRCA